MGRRSLLYDATWLGMALYGRARFEIELLAERPVVLGPATIFVATHRADADVPVVCGSLAVAARIWRNRRVPAAFTPRDDMFLPGFLAGVTPRMPRPLRRLLFGISIGDILRERLECLPIGRPDRMPLAELLRVDPSAPLAEVAPPLLVERLRQRASALGRPEPRVGADVLGGDYADVLWTRLHPEDVPSARFDELWSVRRRDAIAEFRGVVDYAAGGGSILFFPEGTPSKDGSVGPLEPGIAAVVRRGRPRALRLLGIAYDPLTTGRPRVCVSVSRELAGDAGAEPDDLLRLLRGAMPLTRGQLAARHLLRAGDDAAPAALEREAAEAAAQARAEGRPAERGLLDPGRLAESLALARAAAPETLARLAREFESARDPGPASGVDRDVGDVDLDPE